MLQAQDFGFVVLSLSLCNSIPLSLVVSPSKYVGERLCARCLLCSDAGVHLATFVVQDPRTVVVLASV